MLSHELIELTIGAGTAAAARKRIERARKRGLILQSEDAFHNNSRVYFLPEQKKEARSLIVSLRKGIEEKKREALCQSNEQIISFYASDYVRAWYDELDHGKKSETLNEIIEEWINRHDYDWMHS